MILEGGPTNLRLGGPCQVQPRCVKRKRLCQSQNLLADFRQHRGIGVVMQDFADPAADLAHFIFFHSASRQGWRSNADAAWLHRRIHIKGNSIFVYRDAGLPETIFPLRFPKFLWKKHPPASGEYPFRQR